MFSLSLTCYPLTAPWQEQDNRNIVCSLLSLTGYPRPLAAGETLGVPIHVFGPETHMTAIVGMALGKRKVPPPARRQLTTANFLLPEGQVS